MSFGKIYSGLCFALLDGEAEDYIRRAANVNGSYLDKHTLVSLLGEGQSLLISCESSNIQGMSFRNSCCTGSRNCCRPWKDAFVVWTDFDPHPLVSSYNSIASIAREISNKFKGAGLPVPENVEKNIGWIEWFDFCG